MHKLFAIAALSVLAAAPAAAQYSSQANVNANADANADVNAGIGNRIAQLETRLQAGIRSGAIDRQETRSLRPQLRELTRLERQYSRDGLNQQERRDLQQRIRAVRQQIRTADNGSYDRNERYGYNDDDYYDRYANANDDDGYGQGGPYEEVNEVCATRSGIGGLLGNILGSDNCLSVGERVTGNLGALPTEYRSQFRDGGGYYYRYADGRVIQVDSRTRTVARIYDVTD